jgi:hypothetical protein
MNSTVGNTTAGEDQFAGNGVTLPCVRIGQTGSVDSAKQAGTADKGEASQ